MKQRIVKKPSVRRDEILDAAGKLIFSKGYEQMTIQDILDELNIAKGTVYHYFDSKQALLEAFIDRIQQATEKPLQPIIHDPNRSAIEKLQSFFDTLDRLRNTHRVDILRLARVWYKDENALLRQKVESAVVQQRAALINKIVQQGIQEGVFTTAHPDQSGEVILSLLQGMGNTHAKLLFSPEQDQDEQCIVEQIVAVHAAYMDAVERVLGAPPYSLYRVNAEAVKLYVEALKVDSQSEDSFSQNK